MLPPLAISQCRASISIRVANVLFTQYNRVYVQKLPDLWSKSNPATSSYMSVIDMLLAHSPSHQSSTCYRRPESPYEHAFFNIDKATNYIILLDMISNAGPHWIYLSLSNHNCDISTNSFYTHIYNAVNETIKLAPPLRYTFGVTKMFFVNFPGVSMCKL